MKFDFNHVKINGHRFQYGFFSLNLPIIFYFYNLVLLLLIFN